MAQMSDCKCISDNHTTEQKKVKEKKEIKPQKFDAIVV